ncbi:MAG: ribonucleotide-diphosphate reductase subunit beta [Thaumarchaeota archaeon]|nr:MAG: ribonucleotide-diphosphate reductase subunit beta [Nitrososphaerota archaeon]
MKVVNVILFEIGICALEDTNLIYRKQFYNPEIEYSSIIQGEKNYISDLIPKLRNYDQVRVNNKNLIEIFQQENIDVKLMSDSRQDEINQNKLDLIIKFGLSDDRDELAGILQKFAINLSSMKVKETSEKLDLHLVQAVNTLDEIDEIINTISTRIREWYGLHFPELDYLLQNIITYANIVRDAGSRENITKELLSQLEVPEKKIELIQQAISKSQGGDLTVESSESLKILASEVIKLSELRTNLSSTIENLMEILAPNLKNMLTAIIGARLIAKAGSLLRLAQMPSSTIQIIGAEKALFRALKTGTRPPKHGLLFQHPSVNSAPKWQRGKIARALSSKIAIAVRIDVYRKGALDNSLLDKLTKRIETIQKIYHEPPKGRESFDDKSRFMKGSKKSMKFKRRKMRHEKRRRY